jgi:hypothetical protein
MRLAVSPRRWIGCRKNARGSDPRAGAPGLGIESVYCFWTCAARQVANAPFQRIFGRALLRSTTYGRGICLRRKPHCSLWKGSLASFGAVRPTLSGATCPLPPSALGQERGERERALGRGRPSLDLLAPSLFRLENLRFRGLDFLGFPWILSSEARLINGLHGISLKNFSWSFCPSGRSQRRNGRPLSRRCGSAEVFIEQA